MCLLLTHVIGLMLNCVMMPLTPSHTHELHITHAHDPPSHMCPRIPPQTQTWGACVCACVCDGAHGPALVLLLKHMCFGNVICTCVQLCALMGKLHICERMLSADMERMAAHVSSDMSDGTLSAHVCAMSLTRFDMLICFVL